MKNISFLISLLLVKIVLLSQNNSVLYEQSAINHLFDSVLSKDCKKYKKIYYYPTVNNRHSELISISGFEDYLKFDSSELEFVKKEQMKIDSLVLNSKVVIDANNSQCHKVRKVKKKYWCVKERTLFIQVFKRYCYRKDRYIVEITASDWDLITYYFFEIGEPDYSIKRWSKLIRSL